MTDHYALDDEHALHITRRIVNNLNRPHNSQISTPTFSSPKFSADELYGIVGTNLKKSFDVKEVSAKSNNFHVFIISYYFLLL